MNQIQAHIRREQELAAGHQTPGQADRAQSDPSQSNPAQSDPGQSNPSQSKPDVQSRQRHDLDFIGGERDIGDFKKAARHSNRVELLKYVLPIIGMIIIALIMAALIMRPKLPFDITVGKTGMENGKLVMNNPKLGGFDPENRPYSVEASKAIQSVENPTLVNLIKITAKVPMADGLWANITAGNGSFDVTDKKLDLGGGVDVITTDGMKLELKDAYVDLNAGTMTTDRAIKFTSKNASISAQSMSVFENGARIVFETRGLLIIQPPAKKPVGN